MKLKKIICAFCATCMLLSAVNISAFALSPLDNEDDNYDKITINFESDKLVTAYLQNSETGSAIREQNERNVEAAKTFVYSLNLSESGFDYIEASCINQLDNMDLDNGVLTSYSVYKPKTRAVTPTLYGTYNGYTFYSGKYSHYTKTLEEDKQHPLINPDAIIEKTLNMSMIFCGNYAASIAYSAYAAAVGSTTYKIHENAFTQAFVLVDADCRGIYLKVGSTYKMYYSAEKGFAVPYMAFHTNDFSLEGSELRQVYPNGTRQEIPVETSSYSDKQYQMKQAYDWSIYNYGVEYPAKEQLVSTRPQSFFK